MADVDAQPVQVEQPVQPEQPQELQDAQELQPLRVEVEDQPQGENNEPANNNGIIYQYYTDIVNNPWVVSSYNAYTWLKQRNPNVEERLNAVEQTAYGVVSAASQKATQTYETYYVKPRDTVYDVYNTNLERGKWVIQTGKTAAVHSGTISLGAAVLATQLGLQLTAGGAGIVLDTVSACQGAGVRTINNAKQMQQAVEGKIWQTVAEVQRVAKLPIDKAAETSHSILDIVRALVERTLQIEVATTPEDTLRQRVTNIAYAVVSALSAKARQQVIDPVSFQTHQILENLSRSFVIADLVRAKQVWAKEKVEELSASVSDLKTRIETEAANLGTKPEEALIGFIREKAVSLKEQLESLRAKGQLVFGDGTPMEDAIDYMQTLDDQLANAEDIYAVSEAVFNEARHRLSILSSWTTSLLGRKE